MNPSNNHIEPVVHLTCIQYNKTEIDAFANVLINEGIQNILALRGDKNEDISAKEDFKLSNNLYLT